jgi:hypothetical protein
MIKTFRKQKISDTLIIGKYNTARRTVFMKSPSIRDNILAFFIIIALIVITYSNGMHAEWHLDDFDNIVNNSNVHLQSLTWPEIEKALHGMEKSGGHISRPLSYLSFAMNYYWDGLHVFGYHVINTAIHCLASIFLFLLIRNILMLPIFKGRYEKWALGIAFAATILWSTSPVQVTAITYIVQRMASLAGLFYVMTLYFYLKTRTAQNPWSKGAFAFVAGLSALSAFGTKENTLMLPVVIALLELLLLGEFPKKHIRQILLAAGMTLIAISIGVFFFVDLSTITGNYGIRPFSMEERLLTEPRILFLYVSLLLFPVPSRLMLYHDIAWSTSLFDPITTIVAITAIVFLIVLSISISRTSPLIAFCILFFILNHVIEGSFISLELIFEHRNYIPSMFFYLPLVLIAADCLESRKIPKICKFFVIAGFIFAVAFQMYGTHMRNAIFDNRITLLTDNMAKTPRLSVVYHNLGVEYYNKQKYEEAYREYRKALQEGRYMNIQQKGLTYYNLGIYYQYVAKDMAQARIQYAEAQRYTTEMDAAIKQLPAENEGGSDGKANRK